MKNIIGGLLGAAAAALLAASSAGAAGMNDITEGSTPDGYYYAEFSRPGNGETNFETGSNGSFSCRWSDCFGYSAELGLKTPQEISLKTLRSLDVQYHAELSLAGTSWFGVHCIIEDTAKGSKELFVCEAWSEWRPAVGQMIGSSSVNGVVYEYYDYTRYNVQDADGYRDVEQFWCVRRDNPVQMRQASVLNSNVSLKKHFDYWKHQGRLDETDRPDCVTLYVECSGSSGESFCRVDEANYVMTCDPPETTAPAVTTDASVTTTTKPVITVPKKEADADGCFFRSDFENGSDHWETIGKVKFRHDTENYADGSSSLKLTKRGDAECGAAISLAPYQLSGDCQYGFQIAVMQDSVDVMDICLAMAYQDRTPDCLLIVTLKRGQWTLLRTEHLTVLGQQDDCTDGVHLYVYSLNSDADFYIDAASLWEPDCLPEPELSGAVSAYVPVSVLHETVCDGLPLRTHQNDCYSYLSGGSGLKDLLGMYFRVGCFTDAAPVQDEAKQAFYCKHFNSLTCTDALSPAQMFKTAADGSVSVSLAAADPILKFAEENGIGIRGSAFLQDGQIPEYDPADTIRETFAQLSEQYPALDLYAYDVCRNVAGSGLDDAVIIEAFRQARAYAPENCKLYLSESNENIGEACRLAKAIMEAGDYIDGIAVQANMTGDRWEQSGFDHVFRQIASLGLDIQITELQITEEPGLDSENTLVSFFVWTMVYADSITSVTLRAPAAEHEDDMQYKLFDADLQPTENFGIISDIAGTIRFQTADERLRVVSEYEDSEEINQTGFGWPGNDDTSFDFLENLPGDANCDGRFDFGDVILMSKYLVSDASAEITDQGVKNGDVNCDEVLNEEDVTYLLQMFSWLGHSG